MIDSGLQQEINFVMTQARNNHLEFVTVEHLLLALLDINKVNAFLFNEHVDIDEMRFNLEEFIEEHTPLIAQDSELDIVPTEGFTRVIQRSIYQVQSEQNTTVYARNILVSIFSEKNSHAVSLLKLNNISRLDVIDGISIQAPETIEKVPEIDKKLPTVDYIIFDKDGKACLPKVEPYTGNYVSRYKDNSIEELGQYIDGVKNGLWAEYYENGNNKFQVKFVNGKKEGVAIYWDENGRKTKEELYKNDLLDGPTVSFTWYQDGKAI